MNERSIENKNINDEIGITRELEKTVLDIYRTAGIPLTTNEMLKKYYEYVNTLPASDPRHKILMTSRHNALKGARTSLTHKGLIREIEPRQCKVSSRKVSVFKYVGVQYTELEQLKQELARRLEDLERVEAKIRELTSLISTFNGGTSQ
jgi:hypothetical protein